MFAKSSSTHAWRKLLRAILPCLSLVLLTPLFIGTVSSATLEEIKQRGYMVVATEDDYPPFEFVKDGVPMGLDHDLFRLLQKEAPFELRQQILPWQGLLAGVATGQYDVAISAGIITDERAKSLTFTMPIAPGTHYFVTRKGETRIKTVADLNGLTIGVQQGSAQFQALPELQEMLAKTGGKLGNVVQYASYPEAYQDLAAGRTDYVINSAVTVASLVRERPNVFQSGTFPVSRTSYHAWAVKRGNTGLLNYLNDFLNRMHANGTLYQLQEKWFGQSFRDLPRVGLLPGDRPMPAD
jgi:polar amino acid transport system substrate-binding protein